MNLPELKKIFQNHADRNSSINDYQLFGKDGNDRFFLDFIDNSISLSKSKAQEDAIELSIRLCVYKNVYLTEISKILIGRRTEWIKLLCLDWLFNFHKNAPANLYKTLNSDILKKNISDVLKFQSLINLIIVDPSLDSKKTALFEVMSNTSDNAVFYRLINILDYNEFSHIKIQLKKLIIESLSTNKALRDEQIKILMSKVLDLTD